MANARTLRPTFWSVFRSSFVQPIRFYGVALPFSELGYFMSFQQAVLRHLTFAFRLLHRGNTAHLHLAITA